MKIQPAYFDQTIVQEIETCYNTENLNKIINDYNMTKE